MDIFNIFVIHLVIQLLTNVNAELVSSLLGSAKDTHCTKPFLTVYTIGYIQCQKTCIRFSLCDVLQYSKSQLECRLYVGTNCENTQGSADADIYLNRTDIHEAVLGNCQRDGCPTSTCVRLSGGGNTCVVDRVLTHYHSFGATFVDIDGAYYGLYQIRTSFHSAIHKCKSFIGGNELAVLDTPRIVRILTAAIKPFDQFGWWIGGLNSLPYGQCGILLRDGRIISNYCTNPRAFVCKM